MSMREGFWSESFMEVFEASRIRKYQQTSTAYLFFLSRIRRKYNDRITIQR